MSLDLMGHKSHQYLIMDNTTPLRRSIHGDHYESIGGVYLGMTQADLEAAYGLADSTVPDQDTSRLIFGSHHMDVYLRAGIVIGVRIYDGSDLKFEKSGLGAADTAAAYAKAYGWESTPTVPTDAAEISRAYKLPQGEYLRLAKILYSFPFKGVYLERGGKAVTACRISSFMTNLLVRVALFNQMV